MEDTKYEKYIVMHPEPTTVEGFRLRALEIARELAQAHTTTSGIQFTTDDVINSAEKMMLFIKRGY